VENISIRDPIFCNNNHKNNVFSSRKKKKKKKKKKKRDLLTSSLFVSTLTTISLLRACDAAPL